MSTPVEKIKERLTIDDVVGSYIKIEKAGKNFKARCPFHNEKTASFYLTPDRGTYYCFGCGAKGDIFSFVEQFEGLDFMGALTLLANRAGIPLVFEKSETKSEKDRLYAIMEEAAKFFEFGLSQNKEAQEYVKKRGIKDETVKDFRIGYIPNEWRLLYTNLAKKHYTDIEIEKAGLGKKPEPIDGDLTQKTLYDRFRGRIMFPIMDSSGRVIAFSGRILHDDGKSAKYLNSPDTMLYNKSTVLYGIDKAKQDIRIKDYTILVEGQMDLVLSHQAGIKNTVAVSGTALADTLTTKENMVNNLGIVRRLSSNIILAFDSDAAGRKAAMRSAQIALSLGMDVKIASMPEGKDPADMVLHDPESWKNVLREAKPIVEFQIESVMAEVSAQKIDARKIPPLLREKVLPFILAIGGAMERSHFIKMIHTKTGLSEDSVREDLKNLEIKLKSEKAQEMSKSTPTGGKTPGQAPVKGGILDGVAQATRLDMISRKLFGLLAYLDRTNTAFDTDGIRAAIKRIAGPERYDNLIQKFEPSKDELALEAEIFFGSSPDILKKHADELLLNFEEDILRQELTDAMHQLQHLEKGSLKGNEADVERQKHDFMKQCQAIALRLSEISRTRNI